MRFGRPTSIQVVSLCSGMFGIVAHLFAGWVEMGGFVFSPVGHLAGIAALVWMYTIIFAVVSLANERDDRPWAFISLTLDIIGLFLLFL